MNRRDGYQANKSDDANFQHLLSRSPQMITGGQSNLETIAEH